MRGGVRTVLEAAAAVGVAALLRRARATVQAAQAAAEAAGSRAQRASADADRLRRELARRDAELARRGELVERLQRSRRAEREFTRELRTQLQRAHAARGALADGTDVEELVLRAAIELTDARRGLLLSRQDVDSDGDLDLVHAHGFAHDPGHSAIVQRFAREVLERDRIVREDAPQGGRDGGADAEIQNLVAIPLYLRDRFHGVVVCADREGGFEELDDQLLLALGDHAGTALQTQRLQDELAASHRAALRMLADVLEVHDPLLRRQAGEAALLAGMLCRRLGLEDGERELIETAVLLRDVGHVAIPERMLLKPGPLSADERSVVELHPRVGFAFLRELPELHDVASAILYHHERFDGGGYPVGLAGTAIPRAARVVAVVDAYSAIVHDRPHRPARSAQEALGELAAGAGTQFDPEIAQLFLEEMRTAGRRHEQAFAQLHAAVDIVGLPAERRHMPATDPLTLLPGHRAFREAVHAAARGAEANGALTVAIAQLERLEETNRREGYLAGDQALLTAARAAQLAAVRLGGRVYRDSGRRLAVVVNAPPSSARPDVAAELHTELALGPPVRIGVASWQPGETGEDVVRRARAALGTEVISDRQP